jgi:hypothetical protein
MAIPAIVEPIITMMVVVQAAGVWPWLLMLDILAPCKEYKSMAVLTDYYPDFTLI